MIGKNFKTFLALNFPHFRHSSCHHLFSPIFLTFSILTRNFMSKKTDIRDELVSAVLQYGTL